MGKAIMLKNVRGSFLNLFTPQAAATGGDPKYNGAFLMDKNDPQVEVLKAAIKEVAAEKWTAKSETVLRALEAQGKLCLHDGDAKDYNGYAGMFYVSASNKMRPTVIDRDHTPLTAADGKPYSGCYVDVKLDVWAQDNKHGKRINASLLGVMFRADGDAFSGATVASPDDFDTLDDTGDGAGGGELF